MPIREVKASSALRLQILDETGESDDSIPVTLSVEQLQSLYSWMLLARKADERQLQLQRQGRVINFAPSWGQEAAQCGSALALGNNDWLVCGYRELGARLVRGESLSNYFLHYRGFEEGNGPFPATSRLMPISAFIGANILIAVGLARAMTYLRQSAAALVYFGDGATSEGDFHEGVNLASVWNAPVVFFCQNNQWAISTPIEKQTRTSIALKASAYGLPGIQVDGNDVLGVYKATHDALERARAGEGPTLIEAVTERIAPHASADDPKRYRDETKIQKLRSQEPLTRFRLYLESRGIWNADREAAAKDAVSLIVEKAITDAESHKNLKPDTPFTHLREAKNADLERQRSTFLLDVEADRMESEDLTWQS